jgi:hypothetical protein
VTKTASREARWLDVSAERFPGWISSFAERHADGETGRTLAAGVEPETVTFTAADGAVAQCHPPFAESFTPPPDASPAELADAIAAHAAVPRTVGVLLVRLGGYAAGVFTGYPPALADSKVGSRLVHGRSAAGGWSQHRFARRREKQASEALGAAADVALAVFGRWPASRSPLDVVVLGGDKRSAAELRDDPRLAPYLALATTRFITVPDPKRAVLEATPAQFSAVRIKLTEPQS